MADSEGCHAAKHYADILWSGPSRQGGLRIRLLVPCVLLLALALAIPVEARSEASFEYLYIESNEGGSSGGHTAIRFDRDVYHFQHVDGLLVLKRDRDTEFFHSYALLGNRSIHSARVSLSKATRAELVSQFRRRHRAQEAQIEVARGLRADRLFLESLRDRRPETPERARERVISVSVSGLGYFTSQDEDGSPARQVAPIESPRRDRLGPLLELERSIAREHGTNFLSRRREDVLREMEALAVEGPNTWQVDLPASPYDHPFFARSYEHRWRDLAAGLAALDVLTEARPLAAQTYHAPTDPEFVLDREEVLAFERYATELSEKIVAIVESRRVNWGSTMLVGMARLSALTQSIAAGRLVFLDTYPESSRVLEGNELDRRERATASILEENGKLLEASRRYFRESGDAREIAWERLEERGNRYLEIQQALHEGQPLRLARGHLVPSHSADYSLSISLMDSTAVDSVDVKDSRRRERSYSRALRGLYRYGLFGRNCATALFETINDSLGGSVARSKEELGGYIPSRGSLVFIPFVSAGVVNDRYAVESREWIPSYRQRRLREMKATESSLLVALRESNTFTSTVYERASKDSFFVFSPKKACF